MNPRVRKLQAEAARSVLDRLPAIMAHCDQEIAEARAHGWDGAEAEWHRTRETFVELGELARSVA